MIHDPSVFPVVIVRIAPGAIVFYGVSHFLERGDGLYFHDILHVRSGQIPLSDRIFRVDCRLFRN